MLGELLGARETPWVYGVLVTLSCVPVYAVVRRRRDVDELPGWQVAWSARLAP